VLDKSVPVQRRMVGQLAGVEAPEKISEDYNFFVERLRQSLPLFKQLADAVRDNDEQAGAVIQPQLEDLAADTRPFALKHGLRACLPDQS